MAGILLVLLLMFQMLAAGAGAAGPPLTPAVLRDLGELYTDALGRLQDAGMAAADDPGNWAAQPMTRGDLAVLGTAAFCLRQEASDRQGEAAYSDTAHRSVSGSVAVAKDLGLLDGYTGAQFFPDLTVTYGEVGAFLARILGQGPEGGTWPDEYLEAALSGGLLLPDPPMADYTGATATRGWALYMADYAFQAPVDIGGSTRYQLLDAEPPALELFPFDAPVPDAWVSLAGQVSGAASVWATGADGAPQYGTIAADGQFEIPVVLEPGPNTFAVQAADLCGNASEPVEVTVEQGRIPDVSVSVQMISDGDIVSTVTAGTTVEFRVKVADFDGNPIAEPQHLYMTVPDGLVDLDGDDVGDSGAAVGAAVNDGEGNWQWTPVNGEPDTFAVSLRLVKAGQPNFGFSFDSPEHYGVTSRFLRVTADNTLPLAMQFRVGIGAFGEEVDVRAGRVAALEARLADRFGNPVNLSVTQTIRVQCVAGDCSNIALRASPDGPHITTFSIRSTASLYVATGAEGTYQLSFTAVDPGTGDPTGLVNATLTIHAGP